MCAKSDLRSIKISCKDSQERTQHHATSHQSPQPPAQATTTRHKHQLDQQQLKTKQQRPSQASSSPCERSLDCCSSSVSIAFRSSHASPLHLAPAAAAASLAQLADSRERHWPRQQHRAHPHTAQPAHQQQKQQQQQAQQQRTTLTSMRLCWMTATMLR